MRAPFLVLAVSCAPTELQSQNASSVGLDLRDYVPAVGEEFSFFVEAPSGVSSSGTASGGVTGSGALVNSDLPYITMGTPVSGECHPALILMNFPDEGFKNTFPLGAQGDRSDEVLFDLSFVHRPNGGTEYVRGGQGLALETQDGVELSLSGGEHCFSADDSVDQLCAEQEVPFRMVFSGITVFRPATLQPQQVDRGTRVEGIPLCGG